MVNAADLKSADAEASCGFEPHSRHDGITQEGFADGTARSAVPERPSTIRVLPASFRVVGVDFARRRVGRGTGSESTRPWPRTG